MKTHSINADDCILLSIKATMNIFRRKVGTKTFHVWCIFFNHSATGYLFPSIQYIHSIMISFQRMFYSSNRAWFWLSYLKWYRNCLKRHPLSLLFHVYIQWRANFYISIFLIKLVLAIWKILIICSLPIKGIETIQ